MLALVLGDVVESVRTHGLQVVKWDRYHTLCFRCFRAQVDRLRRLRPALHA